MTYLLLLALGIFKSLILDKIQFLLSCSFIFFIVEMERSFLKYQKNSFQITCFQSLQPLYIDGGPGYKENFDTVTVSLIPFTPKNVIYRFYCLANARGPVSL